jgi:hypothetical protein
MALSDLPMTRLLAACPFLLVLTFAPAATAGFMWGYENPANSTLLTPGSAAGLTLPNAPRADGPSDGRITATAVQQWSVAPATSPDRVSQGAYTFDLKLTDYASGASGVLNFKGMLDGSIWKEGADLTNTFTGPKSGTLDLGGNTYTVTLDEFTPPNGFGENGAGRLTADVAVQAAGQPDPADAETTAQTPEPGTAVLGVVGLLTGAAMRRLRAWNREKKPS